MWDRYTIGYVLEQLLEWGYGSGEELYEYLADRVGADRAKATMEVLRESVDN